MVAIVSPKENTSRITLLRSFHAIMSTIDVDVFPGPFSRNIGDLTSIVRSGRSCASKTPTETLTRCAAIHPPAVVRRPSRLAYTQFGPSDQQPRSMAGTRRVAAPVSRSRRYPMSRPPNVAPADFDHQLEAGDQSPGADTVCALTSRMADPVPFMNPEGRWNRLRGAPESASIATMPELST